jgi:hypothetical protein
MERFAEENNMFTKQISIFVENKKGRLAEVTKLLADEAINIRALSLGDMVDFGVLRLIVNDRDRCLRILKAHDFTAQETDVIAVEIDDKPGSLHRVIEVFGREGINIEYIYAFVEKNGKNAIVVFKVDNPASVLGMLKNSGISIVSENMIQNL